MSDLDLQLVHQLELEQQEMEQDPDYINWLIALEVGNEVLQETGERGVIYE